MLCYRRGKTAAFARLGEGTDREMNPVTHAITSQTLQAGHAALHCKVAELILKHRIEPRLQPGDEVGSARRE